MSTPANSLGSHTLCGKVAAQGLSQKAAGELVGLSQQQMQRLMRGLRKPGLAAALAMQAVFGIDPSEWALPAPGATDRPR